MLSSNRQSKFDTKPDRTQPPFSQPRWEERWFSVEGDLDDFIFYDPYEASATRTCSER